MILCCLKRFFDLSNRDITKIFNNIYETKIRNEGFPDGLPRSTVNTQWEDIRRKRHPDFILVHRDVSFTQGPTHFSPLLDKIRSATHRLHIGLVARARDLEITTQERAINPERRARTSTYMPAPSQERGLTSSVSHTSSSSGLLPSHRQPQAPAVSAAPAEVCLISLYFFLPPTNNNTEQSKPRGARADFSHKILCIEEWNSDTTN